MVKAKRCPKCNAILEDTSLMRKLNSILPENYPNEEVNEKNGCRLCGASFGDVCKSRIMDKTENSKENFIFYM
jgi:hypothetical protein